MAKKLKDDNTYKGRLHMLLLYPDNDDHRNAIELVQKGYEHAMILHDKDKYTAEDEAKNPDHKKGELKKPHYHCVIRFTHARWNTAIAKELCIDPRFVQQVRNFDNALLYLIHYNDDDKVKYDPEEVNGGLKKRLTELLASTEKSDADIVTELFTYIVDHDCYISNALILGHVLNCGYLSVYRRNYHILNNLLKEHNSLFTEDDAKDAIVFVGSAILDEVRDAYAEEDAAIAEGQKPVLVEDEEASDGVVNAHDLEDDVLIDENGEEYFPY